MPEVALEGNDYTWPELRQTLSDGWRYLYVLAPPAGVLGYGWAVARLETGGRPWNHNFGNLKCSPACQATHDWVDLSPLLKEGSTEPPIQRAYADGTLGAADFWQLLHTDNYAGVLELAKQGKAYDAAWLMGERGYYAADKTLYAGQVEKLYADYRSRWFAPLPAIAAGRWLGGLLVAVLVASPAAAYWWGERRA